MNNVIKFQNPDLHMHSTVSDGSDSPLELLEKIRSSNIDIFSLTDHDTYLGCKEIQDNRISSDPVFIGGIEFSCEDSEGKYHILGYCYDVNKPSIQEASAFTHNQRREKALNRLRYLEETCRYSFTEEEKNDILAYENPGKPHFANLLLKKGYVKTKAEGFEVMRGYHGKERKLTPEEAIDAILKADGIPVLAHGLFEDGSGLLTESAMEKRVKRLKKSGLMGLECYYSSYTEKQSKFMISLAHAYDLLVTAGSDYHGKNKTVPLGMTGSVDPKEMSRFYRAIEFLLF